MIIKKITFNIFRSLIVYIGLCVFLNKVKFVQLTILDPLKKSMAIKINKFKPLFQNYNTPNYFFKK